MEGPAEPETSGPKKASKDFDCEAEFAKVVPDSQI